jgi:uncharacterized protein involved in exopolysaccharide biosynthesis
MYSPKFTTERKTLPTAIESVPNSLSSGEQLVRTTRLLWTKRSFILGFVFFAFLASVVVSLILPPVYESSTILIPSQPPSMGSLSNLQGSVHDIVSAAANTGDLLGFTTPNALFLSILRSRTVADRLIDRFDLMKLYGTTKRTTARQTLEDNTVISEDRKAGVIVVKVMDRDRYRAAQIAQGYIDELDRLSAELNTGAAHRERVFLDARLAEVKKEMEAAAQKLASFSSTNGVFAVDEQTKGMMEGAAKLEGQIATLNAELQGLEQIYTANNIRVRETRAQIAGLERQLAKLRGGTSDDPGSMDAGFSGFPSLGKLPNLGIAYLDLWRQNKVLNTVFEGLTQRLEMVRVEEVKELSIVKVLDPPSVAEYRIKPRRTLIVLLSCLMATFVSVTLIIFRDVWDKTRETDPIKSFLVEIHGSFMQSGYGRRLESARSFVHQRVRMFRKGREPQSP